MAQYTAEAFQWSGTGYNAQYNTSHTAVLDDDDTAYEGGGDGDETISIDGGAFGGTTGSPFAIDVSFTDTGGNAHVETFYFFNTGSSWYFVPAPGSAFTVGATLGSYQSHTTGWNYDDIVCFAGGTHIGTPHGQVLVENLTAGMEISLSDGETKTLRLVLSRKIGFAELDANPKLRPVRIKAGALGGNLPQRDLVVSRQHRLLATSAIAQRMFDQPEVLISAIKLAELPGIFVDEDIVEVEYFHLLFDAHQVILAEGAPTESLFTGPEALRALSDEAREEIYAILPEVKNTENSILPARLIPDGKRQKQFIARHAKNEHPLIPLE